MRKLEEDSHVLKDQITLIKQEATLRENALKLEIQQLRDEITRRCAKLPNVHLVHHTSIYLWHRYDG